MRTTFNCLLLVIGSTFQASAQSGFNLKLLETPKPQAQHNTIAEDARCEGTRSDGTFTCYFASGQTWLTAEYTNSRINGKLKVWYPDGQLAEEGYLRNDLLHGTLNQYYANGAKQLVSTWREGALHGQLKAYHEDGYLMQSSTWENGLASGVMQHYNSDAEVVYEYDYVKGYLEGSMRQYYPNGQLQVELPVKANVPVDTARGWYEDGTLEHWEVYQNGNLEGRSEWYYPSGNLRATYNFRQGEWHGEQTFYLQNGKKVEVSTYQNGVHNKTIGLDESGYWVELSGASGGPRTFTIRGANGKVQAEKRYDGQQLVETVVYRYNDENPDRLQAVIHFDEHLQPHGLTTVYLSSGEYEEWNFTRGKREGLYRKYAANGNLLAVVSYVNDQKFGPEYTNFSNGLRKSEGIYRQGQKQGLFKEWYRNGQLHAETHYTGGLLDGEYRRWHPNGVTNIVGTYKMDMKVGKWQIMHPNGKVESSAEFTTEGYLKAPYEIVNAEGQKAGTVADQGDLRITKHYDKAGNLTSVLRQRRVANRGYVKVSLEKYRGGELLETVEW